MKALLVGINSQYIHTNLAIRNLYQYNLEKVSQQLEIAEYTINQRLPIIIDEIYRKKPKIILFSCYIWNTEFVKEIVTTYQKISPNTIIVLGGPEVSYHSVNFMEENPFVDIIIKDEGEETLGNLLNVFAGKIDIDTVPGLVYRNQDQICETLPPVPFNLDNQIPFPYFDLDLVKDKILYYETSRGCPFKCSYCLSSISGKVRFVPLETVFAHMDIFLAHKVKQVKFVDRTFNCNKQHAMAIWKYLKEHDNGVTNFHFEISAHLFDQETLEFFKTIRREQFQFEVGVQSTNPQTITQINRSTNTETLLDICKKINSYNNIHQHLDLIAGLPFEDRASFANSFNTVFAIRPEQLQLGFLKILKGSAMESEIEQHEIKYSHTPPFEILGNKWLNYDDILLLKGVEDMVERFYNSGRFTNSLAAMLKNHPSPYHFFEDLGVFFTERNYHLMSVTKETAHTILKDFAEIKSTYTPQQKELALFDICLKEKPKKLPSWIDYQWTNQHKKQIADFFNNPENIEKYLPHYMDEQGMKISRLAHLQVFAYDVTCENCPPQLTYILFDYTKQNLLGNATYYKIEL